MSLSRLDNLSDEYIAKRIIGDFQEAYGDPTSQIVRAQQSARREGWSIADITDKVLEERPRILEIITNAFIGKHRGQKDSYGDPILPQNPNFKHAMEKARNEIRMIRSLLVGTI